MTFREEEREEEQQQQEPSFQKVDKRHSVRDEAEPTDETGASSEEEQPDSEEQSAEAAEEMPVVELDVHDTLRFVASVLIEQAWVQLGLRKPPGVEEVKQDLPQAKLAIDTVEFVIGKLEPNLNSREKTELSNVLNDLRINYVKRA